MDATATKVAMDTLWVVVTACLVFWMNAGFALLETGLCQAKNAVNILFKNSLIPCIGILTYAIVGFNLMYPGADYAGKWFGFAGFGVKVTDDVASLTDAYNAGYTYWTDFLFQAMFAATAATIISGAVAERIKLSTFLVFSTIFVAIRSVASIPIPTCCTPPPMAPSSASTPSRTRGSSGGLRTGSASFSRCSTCTSTGAPWPARSRPSASWGAASRRPCTSSGRTATAVARSASPRHAPQSWSCRSPGCWPVGSSAGSVPATASGPARRSA